MLMKIFMPTFGGFVAALTMLWVCAYGLHVWGFDIQQWYALPTTETCLLLIVMASIGGYKAAKFFVRNWPD